MQTLCKQAKGVGHMALVDLEIPEPGSGEVQIAVQAAGICGTDIHIAHDEFPYNPPVVLGHEFSGIVNRVGTGVTEYRNGDPVMAETTATLCGTCPACQEGRTNHCLSRSVYGVHVNGGFAEFVSVRQEAVHRLPSNVDHIMGAMTEPLAVCVRALSERIQVSSGQVVLVEGPGPIGLLATMLAKAHGATVIVTGVEKDKARLEVAGSLGADLIVRVDHEDLMDAIQPLCGQRGGVDITVEASGAVAAVESAFRCTRKGGTIVQLGLSGGPITIDYSQISFRELNVVGSFAHCWSSFDSALTLMDRGIVDVKAILTGVAPLQNWEQSFHRLEQGDGAKILLTPPGSTVESTL